jgi:quinol monooxygenase YgiN
MADKRVTVVARMKAKPAMEDQVRDAVTALVAPTRKEAGCINYDLHCSVNDPALFMLYDNWVSKKDLDEHLATPYLQDFLAKADQILAEPVDITFWEMISEPGKG